MVRQSSFRVEESSEDDEEGKERTVWNFVAEHKGVTLTVRYGEKEDAEQHCKKFKRSTEHSSFEDSFRLECYREVLGNM